MRVVLLHCLRRPTFGKANVAPVLLQLQPGVNFFDVFMCSFYARRSQKRKKLLELTIFFALFGSASVKAVRKMLVKLTPDVCQNNLSLSLYLYDAFFAFGKNIQLKQVLTYYRYLEPDS